MFHGVTITIPLDFSFLSKISILTVNVGILYPNLNHTHLYRIVFLCFCYFVVLFLDSQETPMINLIFQPC